MQKTYRPFIISSPNHLNQFDEIQRGNPWWKLLLGISKVPADFPRTYVGSKAVAVNFFAKGELTLFERQMDFRSVAPGANNGMKYDYINTSFSFDIFYESIIKIERFEASNPTIKYFNINWVRIIIDSPGSPKDLLLSLTGGGAEMSSINTNNDSLFYELQSKITR